MSLYYLTSSTAIVPFCIISFLLLVSLLGIFAPEKIVFALADFNFGAAGDWGCSSNTKNVENIAAKNPERVLALGDS